MLFWIWQLAPGQPVAVYKGTQWKKPGSTLGVQTVVETKFARCQLHTVRLDNNDVVNDWLWMDEQEHINVIARSRKDQMWHVFEQTKYGFWGDILAPVGGYIETGESPLQAAQREVREELGFACDSWTRLGSDMGFRSSANRGGGFIHSFLADNCEAIGDRDTGFDLEFQKATKLDLKQLRSSLLAGRFAESKWSNTIALALLHLGA